MNDKKVALITGSSRGIGAAIARRLVKDGYAVALNCRNRTEEAEILWRELRAEGAEVNFFFGDVADYKTVERIKDDIQQYFGCDASVLINNAGFGQQKLFTDLTPEEWHRMLAVHLDGAFNTCHVFLPAMIRIHSGTIVNISSMWGQTGGSCEVHYSSAKAGIIGLTKALAKEVGPAGVRVNCVAPGVIDTAMMAGFDENVRQELADEAPLCRLGTASDVASAVSFLVSDEASFITGQVLAPNGGIII